MDAAKRIVSFLPSATEMICALGLADRLAGITHECDFPPIIGGKPIVVRSALAIESMSQSEIDAAVTQRLRQGLSLYQVDERLLQDIAPDLIVTQDLCQVCAPSGNEIAQVLNSLRHKPKILWLTPKTLSEIFDNLRELGAATDRRRQAEEVIADGRARLERIAAQTSRYHTAPGSSAWNGSTRSIAPGTGYRRWCRSPAAMMNSGARAPTQSVFPGGMLCAGRLKSWSSCRAVVDWQRPPSKPNASLTILVHWSFRRSRAAVSMRPTPTPILPVPGREWSRAPNCLPI